MRALSPAIDVLLKALRGSDLPSLADDIEAHLRLGKVRLFRRGEDDISAILDERQRSALGEQESSSFDPYGFHPTEEDQSIPFERGEQIDEALKIISSQLRNYAAMVEDSQRILSGFGLKVASVVVEDIDGVLHQASTDTLASATEDWSNFIEPFREWLRNMIGSDES